MGSIEGDLHFQRPDFQLLPIPPDPVIDSQQPAVLRSLPDLVHFNAIYNPHHLFCLQSSQSVATRGQFDSTRITYHQLACAVESCCSWLLTNVSNAYPAVLKKGSVVQKAPPIALFLESDVGLFIYMIALLTLNIPVRSTYTLADNATKINTVCNPVHKTESHCGRQTFGRDRSIFGNPFPSHCTTHWRFTLQKP